jgi:hypothetical protein
MFTDLMIESLLRDLDRWGEAALTGDQDAQTRIRHRIIDTLMSEVPLDYAKATTMTEILIGTLSRWGASAR